MVVNLVDPLGDCDREHVPAPVVGVVVIEVVGAVLAGASARLDHVLLGVTHHDSEVPVLFHPSLRDGFERPAAAVAVKRQHRVDRFGRQLPGVVQVPEPRGLGVAPGCCRHGVAVPNRAGVTGVRGRAVGIRGVVRGVGVLPMISRSPAAAAPVIPSGRLPRLGLVRRVAVTVTHARRLLRR